MLPLDQHHAHQYHFIIASSSNTSFGFFNVCLFDFYMSQSDSSAILNPMCLSKYSETSIHRFRQGSEKETMDLGKQ
jgi:hypothetical protein